MKIAIYAIAKNEEKFVEKFMLSCKDADIIVVGDTGSTDGTANKIASFGGHVLGINIMPWRFEDARNAILAFLPKEIDVCVCLDLDEVLTEGWREKVEKAFTDFPETDRLRYNYVWNWNADGTPGLTYFADKIHRRNCFRWVGPVHEVLKKDLRLGEEKQQFITDTLIEHYADDTKSRSSYLPLLKLATQEAVHDDRWAHYYARDLMAYGHFTEAFHEFTRHLELPSAVWKAERAASLRYKGDCCWAVKEYQAAMDWFMLAIKEAPELREGYIAMAQAHRHFGDWDSVIVNCKKALSITERPNSYISQQWAWGKWPEEMLTEAETMKKGMINGESSSAQSN